MPNRLLKNIIRFILLVLAQVLVFNHIQFSGYINPYIYVIYILLLPFDTPKWSLLLLGFLIGLTIDLFAHTLGMHAIASVFLAFVRPYVLGIIAPRDGYNPGSLPRIHYMGFSWFLRYSLILVFAHHFILFYVEVFRLSGFFNTLLRVILSTLFSVFIIVLSQYFVFRK